MPSTTDLVRIHYRRPPDRVDVFEQRCLHRAGDHIVTFLDRTPVARPMTIGGRTVLENDSPVLWFTFPDAWHDIGLFHRADGTFTGTYANILTPVRFVDDFIWETTDLFLDIWVDPAGNVRLLDEDELEAASRKGVVDAELADRAREEAARLVERAATKAWPPPVVGEWTLERARAVAGG